MKGSNASISYTDQQGSYSFDLRVIELAQDHQLSGSTKQSRGARHYYPRSYVPGDMEVKGRCDSQEDYQALALFIRKHQRAMLNVPTTERFVRNRGAGFNRLLRLSIPSENILLHGFVTVFAISKKGVFEPVPEFSIKFTPIFDHTAQSVAISNRLRRYYSSVDYAGASGRVTQTSKNKRAAQTAKNTNDVITPMYSWEKPWGISIDG